MGKKGTKRKTKWRALPLGEEAGGSGNEEELYDEDQSTTSSVVGQPTFAYKPQAPHYKPGDKPFRPNRRFSYERYKKREPLVKLESKTFDEEEYTKITTPRQDVLFKKGYFGRKKESSIEETAHHIGEMEGDEPMMDQIIITNGFVDERGHYLVNGNSYEIYDPYSNTVTVVVGPPPYTNGVTQPVLAAVSCQPVPLQPVDWYPPGSDWPSQGSAWTPSYPRTPTTQGEAAVDSGQASENQTDFYGPPEAQIPNLYQQPAYVVPGYMYGESPMYNSEMIHCSPRHQMTETLYSNQNKLNLKEDTSIVTSSNPPQKESNGDKVEETSGKPEERFQEECKSQNASQGASITAQNKPETISSKEEPENAVVEMCSETKSTGEETVPKCSESTVQAEEVREEKRVEKQSHSTQTTATELEEMIIYPSSEVPYKESHSTQTLPEPTFTSSNRSDVEPEKEKGKNVEGERMTLRREEISGKKSEPEWKNGHSYNDNNNHHHHHHHHHESLQLQTQQHQTVQVKQNREFHQNSLPKKYGEESPRKIYQKRTDFSEEKKLKMENGEKSDLRGDGSPLKISYAKKAMAGLEATNDRNSRVVNGVLPQNFNNNKIPNGLKNAQNNLVNGTSQVLTTNGINRTSYTKQISTSGDRYSVYDDKRNHNGNVKNGFVKARYNKNYNGSKGTAMGGAFTQSSASPRDFRLKEKKIQLKSFEVGSVKTGEGKEKLAEETTSESASPSEKSSTVSELSSPTELSSGQNTPPEKLIVRKMEQKIANEINKSFEEKLKQNLTKKNETTNEKEKEGESEVEEEKEEASQESVQNAERGKGKTEGKRRNNGSKGGRGETGEKTKETNKSGGKKKKKKPTDETKEKPERDASPEENSFLPNLILQEPQELIFRSWEGMKGEEAEMISKMDSILPENGEILKSLGLNEDKMNFSKLRLHSDLLMMLPAFGWTRPKFKIEDMFTSSTKRLQSDLFTRRNITSMKSTKPEEFFASVVDSPVLDKQDKTKKESNNRNGKNHKDQQQEKLCKCGEFDEGNEERGKDTKTTANKRNGSGTKSTNKVNKNAKSKMTKEEEEEEGEKDKEQENEVEEKKLGIVEAVNTWLQEQGDAEKVLSIDSIQVPGYEAEEEEEETESLLTEPDMDKKNGTGNPMHALSGRKDKEVTSTAEDFLTVNECMRVANVINDGFVHVDKHFYSGKRVPGSNRKPRSSSLDRKFTEDRIKKHLKFLTDSASFCQDLISDVRNGLPTKGEYAAEELCDPKQSVLKYYTLSPRKNPKNRMGKGGQRRGGESDESENEAFDALEYKFLTKGSGNEVKLRANALTAESDVERDANPSRDTSGSVNKDSCKLQ